MMNIWNPDKHIKAWDFATLAHEGQTYGGKIEGEKIPYINHIGSVLVEIIWTLQNSSKIYDSDLAIQCAILHDVIEDTKYTYHDVCKEFGQNVADGVLALTKNDELASKEEKMLDSLNRIKQQPHEIWIVKIADRITNLYHPPYYWSDEKILAYQIESRMIHMNLHEADALLSTRLMDKIETYSGFLKL